MKKKFLAILLTAICSSCLSQVPSYVPLNGLVAWYPFSGNANDSSGNGNHGTVHGAAPTTDRFGNINSAYSFNGTTNYIGGSCTNFPVTARTVSLWYNGSSIGMGPTTGKGVFGYGGLTCGESWLQVIDNNVFAIGMHCNNNRSNSTIAISQNNSWHHWVVTNDGAAKTQFFVDGQLIFDTTNYYNNTYVSLKDFIIGAVPAANGIGSYADGNVAYFPGKIDDIAIYNRVLTACEVNQLYNASTGNLNCNNTQNANALHFDGANDQVNVGNSTLFNTPNITVQAWIKMDNVFGYYGVVTKRNCCNDLTTFQWSMQTSPDGRMSWAVNTGAPGLYGTADPTPVQAGTWINYTGIFNGNVISLYRNGVLVGTSSFSPRSIAAMNWPVVIGARDGGADWFPGTIDEVRIWDRALTQQEILANMNCHLKGNEQGLIAYYDFNRGIAGGNNAGITTLPDLTPHGLNGRLQNVALSGNSSNWITSGFTDLQVAVNNQPTNTRILVGGTAEFSVSSSNNPVSFQWQTDSAGSGFHDIFNGIQYEGVTNDTLLVNVVVPANNNQLFRCIVSSPGFCPDTSIAALLNVAGALPVRLINFNVFKENKKRLLKWFVENEADLSIFTIERSSNDNRFYQIGNVAATNRGERHMYEFTDVSPFGGVNFYRLKINAIDGSYSYSVIRKVDFENDGNILIYPNPSAGRFTIDFGRTINSKTVLIKNIWGQIVYKDISNRQILEVGLAGKVELGLYFLEVFDKNNVKITIQRILVR